MNYIKIKDLKITSDSDFIHFTKLMRKCDPVDVLNLFFDDFDFLEEILQKIKSNLQQEIKDFFKTKYFFRTDDTEVNFSDFPLIFLNKEIICSEIIKYSMKKTTSILELKSICLELENLKDNELKTL